MLTNVPLIDVEQ